MKSVCVVLYDNKKFLILHRKINWIGWEMLKGNVEKNENYKDALLREIKEETNIKVSLIKKLPIENTYFRNNEKVYQKVFLVKYKEGEVKLSDEHDDFKWVSLKDALKLLTHDNQKRCLIFANDFLVR